MTPEAAIVLTEGFLDTAFAKTCHGLLRGSSRFKVCGVIDRKFADKDAGEIMDGNPLGIKVFSSISEALLDIKETPTTCIVGVATPGGYLPEVMKNQLMEAMAKGLNIVSGLHTFLNDDKVLVDAASKYKVSILDVRKPPPRENLPFWVGDIHKVKTPKIAVFGIDCAVGKRTTCRFLLQACRKAGIKTEMIYTGQTGWMQGYPYGFIFDTMINDFISGAIESAIVTCQKERQPDLILIEGQSSLRNPTGPCGTEFIFSGNVKAIILQHAPGRMYYEDTKVPMPTIESEVRLYKELGIKVLGITLNESNLNDEALEAYKQRLNFQLGIPVLRPLVDGVFPLLPTIRSYMES